MEAAVSNVGSVVTDDQVNVLTLTHFENLQVNVVSHNSLFSDESHSLFVLCYPMLTV